MARMHLASRNERAASRQRKIRRQVRTAWGSIVIVLAILLTLTASAWQQPQTGQTDGQERGARNAGARPKRTPERRARGQNRAGARAATEVQPAGSQLLGGSPILAVADFD